MMNKVLEILHALLYRLTERDVKGFIRKRLPYYLIALLIYLVWGGKGIVITFFMVLAFFIGWVLNGLIRAVKDYRLTQRLNRIHFTAIEFDALKRERDLAMEALRSLRAEGGRGAKAAPMPPRPAAPQSRRFDEDEIREMLAQMEDKA